MSCQLWATDGICTGKMAPIGDKGQKELKFRWIPEDG
jgi:hypothetical protein